MWTYGKSVPTRRMNCLQWPESVQATELLSLFSAVEMALSEGTLILLSMEKDHARQVVGHA